LQSRLARCDKDYQKKPSTGSGQAFRIFAPTQTRWVLLGHEKTVETVNVLAERVRALNIPAVMGLMIGHVQDQTTIPLGYLAELDAGAGTLTLLEEPVR
jgi:muramoyltetrapeptide carboxypeptidase